MTADTSGNMQIARMVDTLRKTFSRGPVSCLHYRPPFSFVTTTNDSQFCAVTDEGLLLLITVPERDCHVS
jgi:hypothetical protein